MNEFWKPIDYDTRYQVSNFGRFRKQNPKNGYRYLKPFRKGNLFLVKIRDKDFNCSRLVANAFIKALTDEDIVYHKNKMEFDNFYKNLEILDRVEAGKRTGPRSRSKRVVEIENGEIIRTFQSARKAAKELFINRQTVCDYCNNKVQKPMLNLSWEDDYFRQI